MQVFRDTRYKVEEDRRHKMLIETVPLSSQQCNAFLGYFLGISWADVIFVTSITSSACVKLSALG